MTELYEDIVPFQSKHLTLKRKSELCTPSCTAWHVIYWHANGFKPVNWNWARRTNMPYKQTIILTRLEMTHKCTRVDKNSFPLYS